MCTPSLSISESLFISLLSLPLSVYIYPSLFCLHVFPSVSLTYCTIWHHDFALLSIACAAACACDYKQRKKSGRTSSVLLPGSPPFLRPLNTKRDRIYPRINPSVNLVPILFT